MLSVIKRSILGAVLLACSTMPAWAANDFYTHGSFPATGSSATSATMSGTRFNFRWIRQTPCADEQRQ